jgi:hypothetical protein
MVSKKNNVPNREVEALNTVCFLPISKVDIREVATDGNKMAVKRHQLSGRVSLRVGNRAGEGSRWFYRP